MMKLNRKQKRQLEDFKKKAKNIHHELETMMYTPYGKTLIAYLIAILMFVSGGILTFIPFTIAGIVLLILGGLMLLKYIW